MAFQTGENSKFFLDDNGSTERELTAYISEISGLPGNVELNDVTALGDAGQKSIPGLERNTFQLSLHWDDTATSGPDVVLGTLRTSQSATSTFKYGPQGDTSGDIRYTGECWITSYAITSRVGSHVTASATFQVDGVVTRDTF